MKYTILQPWWYRSILSLLHLSVLMLPYLFILLFILFRKSVLRFLCNLIGWKHADRNESPGNFREKWSSGPSIFLKFDWLKPDLLHYNLTLNTWLLTFIGKNGKRPHIESCILIGGCYIYNLGGRRFKMTNDNEFYLSMRVYNMKVRFDCTSNNFKLLSNLTTQVREAGVSRII